jgi:hypothetical protein
MATQLDERIEQLENMVKKWFDLHNVTIGRPLPIGDLPAEPHESPIQTMTQRVP